MGLGCRRGRGEARPYHRPWRAKIRVGEARPITARFHKIRMSQAILHVAEIEVVIRAPVRVAGLPSRSGSSLRVLASLTE
jgi:hypothetical protein